MTAAVLTTRVRAALAVFVIGLVLSGVTAFPLHWEIEVLARLLGAPQAFRPEGVSGLTWWIMTVREGLRTVSAHHPFLAYGTDWLAFAHLVIAVAFLGPWRDPVCNRWVIEWGMFSCVAVLPLALIAGPARGIPFGWRLIDCSFGVFGIIPLALAHRWTRQLERLLRKPETKIE